MKSLTDKEEDLMRKLWTKDEMIAREILEMYPEPRPHFNTVATFLRILEKKGWVKHRTIGNTNLYSAKISQDEFSRSSLKSFVSKFFNGSMAGLVNALLKDENLSDKEIAELIEIVKNKKKQ
ncbi:MAG: BlaI/MecI/CopY family transcriptional regulator [Muribaculaceae bacterium]|nr:BlaI/MecI/CopY family transcriptional regulator [Muribaculaceae bacterium]